MGLQTSPLVGPHMSSRMLILAPKRGVIWWSIRGLVWSNLHSWDILGVPNSPWLPVNCLFLEDTCVLLWCHLDFLLTFQNLSSANRKSCSITPFPLNVGTFTIVLRLFRSERRSNRNYLYQTLTFQWWSCFWFCAWFLSQLLSNMLKVRIKDQKLDVSTWLP